MLRPNKRQNSFGRLLRKSEWYDDKPSSELLPTCIVLLNRLGTKRKRDELYFHHGSIDILLSDQCDLTGVTRNQDSGCASALSRCGVLLRMHALTTHSSYAVQILHHRLVFVQSSRKKFCDEKRMLTQVFSNYKWHRISRLWCSSVVIWKRMNISF